MTISVSPDVENKSGFIRKNKLTRQFKATNNEPLKDYMNSAFTSAIQSRDFGRLNDMIDHKLNPALKFCVAAMRSTGYTFDPKTVTVNSWYSLETYYDVDSDEIEYDSLFTISFTIAKLLYYKLFRKNPDIAITTPAIYAIDHISSWMDNYYAGEMYESIDADNRPRPDEPFRFDRVSQGFTRYLADSSNGRDIFSKMMAPKHLPTFITNKHSEIYTALLAKDAVAFEKAVGSI